MAYANNGITCPKCGSKSYVSDSVPNKEQNALYRERTCTKCEHVFFTTEFVRDNEDDIFRKLWLKLRSEYKRDLRKEKHDQTRTT